MKKFLAIFLMLLFSTINVEAKKNKTDDISQIIKDSGVSINSIAVSIKKEKDAKVVYSLNDKILMTPASVQKVLTTPVILETLGEDYKLSTSIYSRGENAYVIKLGADPYLTSGDLKKLVKNIDMEVNRIYIDDKILDNVEWGEGWQWDDAMNPLMPRFGSYNLDRNLIKLTIVPDNKGKSALILNQSQYPFMFYNNLTKGQKNNIKFRFENSISSNTLILDGTIASPTTICFPTNNLKRYFDIQLTKALENRKIYLKNKFTQSEIYNDDTIIETIEHDINTAVKDVLMNSNNLVSETLFKLAGAKYNGVETGTDKAGVKMFEDYCTKNKLDKTQVNIVDSSGVSKNNLVSANFITEFLFVNKNNEIMSNLPSPGQGTLSSRMLTIKDNLKAKTGTLSNTSTIAGYLTSKSGEKFVFCIMINDLKLSASDKKMLEDFIIREAYLRL